MGEWFVGIPRFVLAFYRSAEHAEEAIKEVKKNRFRRSAAVHRAEDGRLTFIWASLAPRNRAAFGLVLGLVLAVSSGLFGMERWAFLLLGLAGFPLAWFAPLWLGFGLSRKVILEHAQYVLPGEGLVVV